MENLLWKFPNSPTPEDALVTVYRVYFIPVPRSEISSLFQFQEGLFYCMSNKPKPELLLAELNPHWEIVQMDVDAVGDAQRKLGHASTRVEFDKKGYVFKLTKVEPLLDY